MKLLKKSSIIDESKLVVDDISIQEGSGVFISSLSDKDSRTVKVYYHRPKAFDRDSKFLIVVPGAGRNGKSYRDTWIQYAEEYKVLVLSLTLEEELFPFEDYHLCGMVSQSNFLEAIEWQDSSNIVVLDETQLTVTFDQVKENWIFGLFDSLFYKAKEATGSEIQQYDLFGHSAGGQILHRMALFDSSNTVNQIVSANSGFYTLPDPLSPYPFGLNPLSHPDWKSIFNRRLIVLTGEKDNATETKGTLLHSNTVNEQGLHRNARAKYFYNYAKAKAKEINTPFNWQLVQVKDVGHDHRKMAKAAAEFLYQQPL